MRKYNVMIMLLACLVLWGCGPSKSAVIDLTSYSDEAAKEDEAPEEKETTEENEGAGEIETADSTENTDADPIDMIPESSYELTGEEPEVIDKHLELAEQTGYLFPDFDKKILSEDEYKDCELYIIRRAVNEAYARHGRIFTNEGQRIYFESRDWYQGIYSPEEFDEGVFNEFELANIKAFQKRMTELTGNKNASTVESRAIEFLNEAGVNGFVGARFNSIMDFPADIGEIVYQMEDSSVDTKKLEKIVTEKIGSIETDLTYISSANLDKFLKRVTGYGLNDKQWNYDYVGYAEEINTYYLMHGDTNFNPVVGELMSIHGDEVELTCYYTWSDYDKPFTVVLRNTGNDFQFISILD